MTKAHIIEVKTADGWATMFCGRRGEQKVAYPNTYLSETGKSFYRGFSCDDTESLNAWVNCTACQRAFDQLRAA